MYSLQQLETEILQLPIETRISLIQLIAASLTQSFEGNNFVRRSTGLCGIWQDSRHAEEISQEIINNRSNSRDITL